MPYINPFDLLGIASDNFSDVDALTIKKAKRSLLSEIELSDTDTILFNKNILTKSDLLKAFDELDNKDKKDFHFFVFQNKDLNNFLSNGGLTFFYKYKIESIYKLTEFIEFISPYFAYQYNKQLSKNFKEGNFEIVKLIVSITPIVNESGKELCYRGTYLFLKEIASEIIQISNDIENKESSYFKDDFEGIADVIRNKVKINQLNILPGYFQNIRNQVAEAISITAIKIHNNYYYYKLAHELMTIAYNIFTDGLIEQTILKNQVIIKKHHEEKLKEEAEEREAKQYSELFTRYKSIIQNFDKVIEEIDGHNSSYIAKKFSGLYEYLTSHVNVPELNSLPYIFNNTRTRIAIQIKHLSVTIWNEYESIEPSFKLIQLASAIKVDDETTIKIKTDFDTLKAIEERKKKYGKPIASTPSMGTTNGIGTKIYEDTLYFVLFFIPIFPISRYSLENSGSNSYRFFGKLELHKWQKIWQSCLGGAIILLIVWGIANSNSSSSNNNFTNASPVNTTTQNPPVIASQPIITPIDAPSPPKPVYTLVSMKNGNITGCTRIKPKYDYNIDNELKITVDNNTDVAIKLINSETGRCIRYVYIKKNTTYSIRNIPEGKYYTKIAYGNDWETIEGESSCTGRFSSDVSYKKDNRIVDYHLVHTADGTQVPSFTLRLYTAISQELNDDNQAHSVSEDDFNND